MRTLPILIVCFLALVSIPQAQAWLNFDEGDHLTESEVLIYKEGECTKKLTIPLNFTMEYNYSVYFTVLQTQGSIIINLNPTQISAFTIPEIIYNNEKSTGEKTSKIRLHEPGKYAISINICPTNAYNREYTTSILITLADDSDSKEIDFTYTLEKEKEKEEEKGWTITQILIITLIVAIILTLSLYFTKDKRKERGYKEFSKSVKEQRQKIQLKEKR